MAKPLHAVPSVVPSKVPSKVRGRQPREAYPRPTFEGTKPSPEVARALSRVLQDHTYTKPRDRYVEAPSRLGMFLWTVVIAGLLLAGYLATAKRLDEPRPPAVRTYQLQPT